MDRLAKDVRIEAKWQGAKGSIDEKLPFLYLDAAHAMPEDDVILIVEGPGWREGAINWLRDAVGGRLYLGPHSDKRIKLMDLGQFASWAGRVFRKSEAALPVTQNTAPGTPPTPAAPT